MPTLRRCPLRLTYSSRPFEEVVRTHVACDPREVLRRLGHRRAVVEATPDTGVLDVLDEVVEPEVGAAAARRRCSSLDRAGRFLVPKYRCSDVATPAVKQA